MILDKMLVFGSDDSVAAVTSTAVAADYVCDMGTKKTHLFPLTHSSTSSIGSPDYGEGGDLWYNALITTALKDSGASTTFTIKLVTHSTSASIAASGTTLLTATTAALSSTSATSSADAGDYLIRAKVPAGAKRYLATVYVASADGIAAGKISSWLGYTATNI